MQDHHDDASVRAEFACPWCGERRMDELIWFEDDEVECQRCGCRYDPADGVPRCNGRPDLDRRETP